MSQASDLSDDRSDASSDVSERFNDEGKDGGDRGGVKFGGKGAVKNEEEPSEIGENHEGVELLSLISEKDASEAKNEDGEHSVADTDTHSAEEQDEVISVDSSMAEKLRKRISSSITTSPNFPEVISVDSEMAAMLGKRTSSSITAAPHLKAVESVDSFIANNIRTRSSSSITSPPHLKAVESVDSVLAGQIRRRENSSITAAPHGSRLSEPEEGAEGAMSARSSKADSLSSDGASDHILEDEDELGAALPEEDPEEEMEYAEMARRLVEEAIQRATAFLKNKPCTEADVPRYLRFHEEEIVESPAQPLVDYNSQANIEWMDCASFTEQLGRNKIIEFIKTWQRDESWLYDIELIETDELAFDTRYRYRLRWSIPTRRKPIPRATACVYFTMDVSKIKVPSSPVKVSYVFETNRLVHKPGESVFHEQWLKDIIINKTMVRRIIDF